MSSIVKRLMNTTKKYTVLDFGFLKISVLSAGILLGTYYEPFFKDYTQLLWIAFLISFVWIMYQTFIRYMR